MRRNLTATIFCLVTTGLAAGVTVAGCATAADVDVIPGTDSGTTPTPTFTSDPDDEPEAGPPRRDSGPARDASTPDATVDAGPPPPNPGDACTDFAKVIVAPCGACGTKSAVCLAPDDGGATGVVSEYGACAGEVPNGCIPGTVEQAACGRCGKTQRICGNACSWIPGQCAGEPVNACEPGLTEYSGAGCTAGTYRSRACGDTCTLSSFSASCDTTSFSITLGALGVVKNTILHLAGNPGDRPASCYLATGSNPAVGPYTRTVVPVTNPTGAAVKVHLSTSPAPGAVAVGGVSVSVFDAPPNLADSTAFRTCQRGATTFCSTTGGVPCGPSSFGGLSGTSATTGAFAVPAGGTVYVVLASYDKTNVAGKVVEGYVNVAVKAEAP